MFKKVLLPFFLMPFFLRLPAQNTICADSSYRVSYVFNNKPVQLFTVPDTAGYNFFSGFGNSQLTQVPTFIPLFKTNWGDSILWAKKLTVQGWVWHIKNMPDGGYLLTGENGLSSNLRQAFLCRLNNTGKVLWAKYLPFYNNYILADMYSSQVQANITISNNSIYVILQSNNMLVINDTKSVIAKFDFNGNCLWRKSFTMNDPYEQLFTDAPVINGGSLFFCVKRREIATPSPYHQWTIITQLNDIDGGLQSANILKQSPDSFALITKFFHINPNGTFTLKGSATFNQNNTDFGFFVANLDNNMNPLFANGYTTPLIVDNGNFLCDNNDLLQNVFFTEKVFAKNEKYILSTGKSNEIIRSRKFDFTSNIPGLIRNSVRLDNKQNIHFLQAYSQGNVWVNEYVRIGNFAPNSTLSCIGKDTPAFTIRPLNFSKTPFIWDAVQSNVLYTQDVPYTEDTAFVTKQLICKIVSYCDTVKINGPSTACIKQPVRYSVKRNATCQKFTDWNIDSAFANIVNMEGDSAITLSFKKPFTGYLHAALSDCVIKDSIFIKAVTPKMLPLINRTDSLLCPGKTITLSTNNGYTNYVWQGSSNGQQFTISAAGKYVVTALDSCSNPVTDSIVVTVSDTTLTLPASQTICLYDTAFITLPGDVNNITWQPATNSLLRNKTIVAYPSTTTLYTVTAERQTNCAISRISLVTVKPCPQTFYMPNSFTPNNDGLNDKFKPTISQPLAAYRFTIYNRYGQNIFTTGNQNLGWDGMYQNSKQPMGGYIYYCTYRFNNGAEKTVKGYFMLLR